MTKHNKIQIFSDQKVRTVWDSETEKWYFSVVDVVGILTDSENPRRYLSDLKRKLTKEGSEVYDNIVQLKLPASDGKMRMTDVADQQQLFRLIQSIPSPKAEPFKQLMAQVASNRIDQMQDPELSIQQSMADYRRMGYSDEWINQRIRGYFKLFKTIQKFVKLEDSHFSWENHVSWGISDEAWRIIESSKVSPLLVFAHPKVLNLYPSYLKYYRSVAMVSQKGLTGMAHVSNVSRMEEGKVKSGSISKENLSRLVITLNEIMSAVVSLTAGITANEIQGMMYATAGTKIDGSWRNQIGSEGERVIRSIIFKELINHEEISSIVNKSSIPFEVGECNVEELMSNIDSIKTINLTNGSSVLFSSEPDVMMYDNQGKILGVIEIKSGLDPAGALERLGAMLKSFENTLTEYPDAVTILVASCLTEEADSRLNASMSVRQKYITTRITSNDSEKRKFVNRLRSIMKLTDK